MSNLRVTAFLFLSGLILASIIFTPFHYGIAATEGGGLVPCGNTVDSHPCGFRDLITLIDNIISFLLYLAIPVATLLFSYAGVLYLTAGDKPDQVKKAHKVFIDVFWGVIIMFTAYLIVTLIINMFLSNEYKTDFFLQ